MKRFIIAGLAVGLIGTLGVVLAPDAGAAPKEKSPFVGKWSAVDPDGTDWQLSIRGSSGSFQVRLVDPLDEWADECPSPGRMMAIGKGVLVDADTLVVHFRKRCYADRLTMPWTYTLDYNEVGDQLVGDDALVWSRR